MKHVLLGLILLICYGVSYSQSAVFNPADPIVNYDKNQPAGSAANPIIPYNNQIVKWVRTPKVAGYPSGTPGITWNTNNYKCYMVNNLPFRMRYPNGYVPGTNDGKKFPIMIFWHGGGETEGYYSVSNGVYTYHAYGNGVWDNEYQLYQGAQAFETKTTTDQDAFILFPQSPVIGFDGSQFAMMNVAIDEIINNCKGDADRVISMGLSVGGFNCIQYAMAYPQRVSSVISSSGIQVNTIANSMGPSIHIPLWYGDGGKDTGPDSSTAQIFENGYNASGGIMLRSYLPLQGHVMWDYQWAEEPSFDSAWSQAHKANPLVYYNNRFYCPGSTNISSPMGITPGYYAYRWDKDGVIIPGATSSDYTATAFGTYRCSFMRTSTSAWSAWSLVPAKIVPVCPPVTGTGTGLAGNYYTSNTLTGLASSRLDPSLNFYIENGASPATGISSNSNYSVRWTGKIQAKFTEPYTIYTYSDDGVRLWINGQLVIDNWTTHKGTENSATISMVAGQQYDIKIEYYNNYNFQNVYNSINSYNTGIFSLRWSSPSTIKTMVPKTQLYPTGTGVPTVVPLCTTNLTPANAAVLPTTTSTTLTWTPVANAGAYDVYFWTGATPPASATAANLTTASYTVSGLVQGATYNWYVVPKNNIGSATGCSTNNITTFSIGGALPACVINTAPTNASTIGTPTTATLTWPSSSGATSYDVYLWTGATPPASPTANIATTTYSATGLTASTLYNWYIAPRNASGATACAANATTFTTSAALPLCVTNTSPANASTIGTQTTATLTWPTAAGATSYDVYLWTGATAPSSPTANVATTTYSATGLTAATQYSWYIAPRNATGAATTCAAANTTTFTTAVAVPACVTNTSPGNGSTIATQTTATLTWPIAAGATSYDVYLWTGATAPSSPTANVATTSYSASSLTASTAYNWYIAPRNAGGAATGCDVNNKTTFTTAAILPVPSCVINTSPANGTTLATQTTATLTWPSAATATSYDVYIWTGATPPASPTANVTTTTYNVSGLTASTLYNWFIAPRNASGPNTTCGSTNVTSFTTAAVVIPVPGCAINSAPADGATIGTQTTATLTWGTVANATSYDVYIWTGATAPTSPTTNVTATTYAATGLVAGTLYNWYVIPKNATGPATGCDASARTSFTTAAIPVPACVTNTSPANASTIATQTTATLTWPSSATATSYDVYIWTGATPPASPTVNVATTSYSAAGLTASTLYNWYIAPRNASGAATTCAAANTTTFTTAAVPVPACVTNTSPANASTIATQTTATLTWPSSATATSYDVYIWTGATPPASPTANVATTTYSATGLTASTLYNWYIAPRNATGAATTCAAANTTTFTTATIPVPACVTNTSPADASTIATQTTATLTWPSSATATSYDVYIWTGATPPASPTANVATTSYSATGLTASTLYNWYIAPRNATGAATTCAAANTTTFTTAAIPVPACVINTAPANGSTIATQTTATLTWPSSATATSYDVYIWTGATPPASPTANVATTSYSATGLTASTLYNWYIAPRNATGAATTCAAANTTTFTTATIPVPACVTNTSPADASTIATQTTATLTWPSSATATSYDVYIWTGATPPASPTANVATTSYSATGLTASTLYNWYIAPRNATGAATACAAANTTTFTTAAIPVPACVTNTAPANGSTIATQTTATLTWPSSATATSYDVYIWTGATPPASPTANVATTSYSATGLTASTLYNWYIAPRNATGAATTCAAANTTTFTTAAIPVPACVINTAPANGSTIATQTTATLTWPSSATATSYDVYIWTGATPPASPTANVATTSYSATGLTASTLYNWYIAPRNATGAATTCGATNATAFTTAAVVIPVPVCATNSAPANGTTIATQTTATLAWGAVADATSYDVYIWTGATPPASPTANITTTSYSATGLTANTTYNWYVVPKNATGPAVGCDVNNKSTFTTASVPVPVCAVNSLPANGTTIGTQTTATLTWGAVTNATSYDVYLWTGVTAPTTPIANVSSGTSYSATGLSAATLYNWYIVPKNATGSATGCDLTNATTFTTASIPVPGCTTNSLPANGATIATQTTVTLTWASASTATSYDVYLWTGAIAPTTPIANVTTTTYGATGLTAASLYNWYIVPRNAGGPATGCSGNASTFTTAVNVPVCAANSSPANGTTVASPNSATLVWGAVSGATSYDVYIWTGATPPVSPTSNTSTTSYNATGLTATTTYNWYIVPRNASGPATGCDINNKTNFTTPAVAAPACATNSAPADASTIATQTTATLTWGSVATATSYDVYIWTGATPPASATATVSGVTTYNATGLTAATLYNWYVVPKNASGSAANCDLTNATSFTTAAAQVQVPDCATNNTPANNSTVASQTAATLTWGTVATATSYDVYLWTGATAPSSPTANVTTTTYSATGLIANTQYSWYIVPRNAGGPAVGCSTTNQSVFTTAAIPVPSCAINSLPADGSTIATQTTATLTWGVVSGATSYDVYLWTGVTVPTTPTANVTTATYSATGLVANTTYNWYVVPKNASGPATGCGTSAKTTFTTAAIPVPACAINSSPGNASTIATQTTATLTWGIVSGATSYDVYIWTGAIAPTTATANVSSATYSATGLTASTLYNWYVVPRNAGGPATGCDVNNKTTFTTAAIAIPSCVINTSPANGTTIATQTTATLTWPSAAGATSYDVYLWTGATPPASPTANVATTSYSASGLTASTLYNWYIAPRNSSGAATTCGTTNATAFTTAAIVIPVPDCAINSAPANGATIPTQTTATLTWGTVANATSYDVYIWTGATAPTVATANVTAATYSATGLSASTLYNWYVIPKNATGAATGCDVNNKTTFTTAAIPVPACVTNTTPANGSTIATPTTATLTWPSSATATSYDVYIWTGATPPASPTANVATTSYSATGLTANTVYNWYIAPRNASGANATCSTTNTTVFTTATGLPLCVINTSPANASTIATQTTATLTWPSAATATSYDVYIWTGATPPASPTANVATNTYDVTGLTASTLYNWYIAPRNANGAATGCGTTNATTFTTAAVVIPVPVCAVNSAPANGSTIATQTTATLTWGSVPNATSYDVYIWTGAVAPTIPVANVTAVTYAATGLVANTTYNWYVVPKNTTGAATGCDVNNKTTFTTAIPVPACVTNTSPANASTIATQTTATLTWSSAATATSYDVYIWTGATPPASPTANVATTSYSATGLTASTLYNWYIAPRNSSGAATTCGTSNATTFTTAAVIVVPSCVINTSPANGSTIATQTTATLTWPSASGATSYDVYIWTGATPPASPTANVATTSYSATGLTASTLYNWYIAPRNSSGAATTCGTTNATAFTTAAVVIPVPGCATNSAPANGTTIATQTTATLTWGTVANATSYDVYIWTGATAPTVATANVTAATYSATGLSASTLYSWYVIPKNATGPATGCDVNNKTSFTTAAIAVPACVTNTSPVNASTIATQTTATLTWPSAATATSYDVYIWTGATPPASPTANVATTSYSATGLTASTLYNWYIAPRNAGGAATTCAAANTTTFTTAAIAVPACVTNTSPANASTIATQTTATLTWPSAATATSYDVYIWTGATPPASPTANVATTSYSATGLTASTLYNWYIAPRNAGGAATTCAAANTTTFTTAAIAVPACVTNTSPANASTIATQTTATLTWPSAATATSYDVYIWTGATPPASPTANVATTSYSAAGLTASTLYNWYIAPRNAGGAATTCAAANTTTFTTAAIAVPACVTNTSPANASTIGTQTTATLTWPSAATATSYDVYIWTGATPPASPTANVATTSYSATGLTASTLYNWYIAPRNAGGAATTCAASNTTTFTTAAAVVLPACVVNTSPANGATLLTQTTVRLTWPASSGATSYDVYLAAGNAIPTILTINTTALTYYVTGLTANTLYSWYIAPRNANGANTACGSTNKTTFTTAVATGGGNLAPVSLGGSDVSITLPVSSVTLDGTASYDPDGSLTEYYWFQAQGPISSVVGNNFSAVTTATGLTTAGTYIYVLQVTDNNGVHAYSQKVVTVNPVGTVTVPVCVTNTSPANGSTIATQTTATLTWPAATGATSYDVYLWTGATAPTSPTVNVATTSYSPTGLTPGALYSWYIAPRNTAGAPTNCAAANTTTFTTALAVPACVINTSPANASTIATQTTATLTWPAAAGATSYDVYIWTGATAPVSPIANVTTTTYSATNLSASTLYNWYIAPRNAAGAAANCGATNATAFTTAAGAIPVPVCVTNTSPANASTIATQTTATLTWPAAATATSYDVYIWTGATAPTIPTANVASTTYSATNLTASTVYSWYIAPRNASGAATTCAAANTTTFTTAVGTVPVPGCAVNSAPANGATIATQTTATLTWGAAANATSYDVYIWTGAIVPTSPTTNVATTSYSATGLTAATGYSWYIAPRNASGAATTCATTNTTTFTTAAAVVLPACVVNTSPANGSTLPSQTTARLIWPASPGATSYDVYLAAGTGTPTLLATNTTALTYYATGLLTNTLYSWYVAPRSANGANTACGSTNKTTFTTAIATGGGNLSPVSLGGSNVSITLPVSSVTLDGTASYDPDGSITEYYWFQAQGPVTSVVANNFSAITTASGLTTAGTYIYVLQVTDNNGVHAYSQKVVTVNPSGTVTNPPACVTNTSPANGSTIATQTTATLTWPAAATAVSYDVYLAAGAGTPTVLVANTSALSYSAAGLTASTLYTWYIAPRNAGGAATTCATANATTFTTAAAIAVPACVTNTSPANASTLATQTTATLTWPAASTATSYDVYLWTGATAPTSPTINVTTTSYSATSLLAGTVYSWYIAPRNAGGAATTCAASNTTTFTTASAPLPVCVTNTSPANGGTLTTATTATLTWPAAANATSYDVYLWTGATVPTIPTANVTALTYSATGLTGSTTYSWYIAPRNTTGVATGCATTNKTTFTTASSASQPTASNGGSDVTITLPVSSVTLDGSASTGNIVQYYWFQAQGPITSVVGNNFAQITTATGLTTPGTYIYVLQVIDNLGVHAYSQKVVTVKAAGTRVIDTTALQITTAETLVTSASVLPDLTSSVSPNPVATGQMARLLINSDKAGTAAIAVVNISGFTMATQKVKLVAGTNTATVSTTALGKGLYIINIQGGRKPLNVKLMIH